MVDSSEKKTLSGVAPAGWEAAINDIRREDWDGTGDPDSKSKKVNEALELYLATKKANGNLPEDAEDDVEGIDAGEVLARHNLQLQASEEAA